MILRPATRADVPALSRLGIDSFVFKFGDLYSPEDLATFLADHRSEAAYAGTLADPAWQLQVAERDGWLLGYCALGSECSWLRHARGQRAFELKQLYLDPQATGGGIGGALMDWAIATARAAGGDELQLSVYSGNEGAQRFYARKGFGKIADVTFRVGEQIDHEFLYAKLL